VQREVARGCVEVNMSMGGAQGGGAVGFSTCARAEVDVRWSTKLGSLEASSAT
jgi:hypothetical protein